jgi:hypothetical protein
MPASCGVVVLAAEEIVVHPRDVRLGDVDLGGRWLLLGARRHRRRELLRTRRIRIARFTL